MLKDAMTGFELYQPTDIDGAVDLLARFARGDARDNLRTVLAALLRVETAFGSGQALLDWAEAAPDWNLLGIEVYEPGIGSLLKGMADRGLDNIRVITADAAEVLARFIAPGVIGEVRVFFPDPWPKMRHHKRRLINPPFAALLAERLSSGGLLRLATDWQEYAEQMLAVLNAAIALYIYTLLPEFLMRFLAWILVNTIYRVRPRGTENIPDEGPAVVVCNHVSYMDPILLSASIRRPMRFVMYYKIFQLPLLRFLFRHAKAIPIASAKEDEQLMNEAFEKVDAELKALSNQVNPHFLFNSLNTIASLIPDDPAGAEAATLDLADIFRGSMRRADQLISLEDELMLARQYLAMEQRRLGDRLELEWRVDELPSGAQVLPLMLQPLLENAVAHGIQAWPQGGKLSVYGRGETDQVVITIGNPLAPAGVESAGNGMAIQNIRERLALAFGSRAKLLTNQDQEQFYAVLVVPYETHSDR